MQVSLWARWNGRDFRTWRESLRLTQAEAARLLGVSRRSVINWEAGEAEPLTPLVTLACFFITEHQAEIGEALQANCTKPIT